MTVFIKQFEQENFKQFKQEFFKQSESIFTKNQEKYSDNKNTQEKRKI